MKKFLYMGDIHMRGNTPRSRTDDYPTALKRKLREVFDLAKRHDVYAILCAGDIFDMPQVAPGVLNDFADVLEETPVPIYTTAGNHDIYGYNLDTYPRTSLRLLQRLLPGKLYVINDPAQCVTVPLYNGCAPHEAVSISFTPYSGKIDINGYGYSPEGGADSRHFKVHVAHGMLLDHEPPFDRYTYIGNVQTDADLVLTGHDHLGYGLYERADGVKFLNCGSLTRLSADVNEMRRPIQVALITVGTDKACAIDLIPLQSALPGEDVLDRTQLEATNTRRYAMEQFAALIETRTGEKVALDVNQILEQIAAQESIAPDVVQIALQKIDAAREQVA